MVHATAKSHAGVGLRSLGDCLKPVIVVFVYFSQRGAAFSQAGSHRIACVLDSFDETYYQAYGVRCLPEQQVTDTEEEKERRRRRSSIARSIARSLDRSVARSLDRSVARSLDRSVDRSITRSVVRNSV
jgi:hypothetical protein